MWSTYIYIFERRGHLIKSRQQLHEFVCYPCAGAMLLNLCCFVLIFSMWTAEASTRCYNSRPDYLASQNYRTKGLRVTSRFSSVFLQMGKLNSRLGQEPGTCFWSHPRRATLQQDTNWALKSQTRSRKLVSKTVVPSTPNKTAVPCPTSPLSHSPEAATVILFHLQISATYWLVMVKWSQLSYSVEDEDWTLFHHHQHIDTTSLPLNKVML